ncbi:MAG: hypothetical protein K0S82_2313, partial [Gaiellaceae bacterium]|nr:hypothetical protein [Gaiellaceae bacterium]
MRHLGANLPQGSVRADELFDERSGLRVGPHEVDAVLCDRKHMNGLVGRGRGVVELLRVRHEVGVELSDHIEDRHRQPRCQLQRVERAEER